MSEQQIRSEKQMGWEILGNKITKGQIQVITKRKKHVRQLMKSA